MCQKAWEVIYCVSHEKTLQLVREVKSGDIHAVPRMEKTYYKTTKEAIVEFWMGEYFDKIADYMPDRDTIHLLT